MKSEKDWVRLAMTFDNSEIIIYQTEDGHTKIDVRMEDETVWLTQAQISELFQTTKQNISLHINNAFKEGELDPAAVVKEYLTTAAERDFLAGIKNTQNELEGKAKKGGGVK